MQDLFQNIRFYILVFGAFLMASINFYIKSTYADSMTADWVLLRTYALVAITYLYIAILATPLTKLFPKLPFKAKYLKARRAIGVSAFFFALVHATLAFFIHIGGIEGFLSTPITFQIPVLFGTTALFILFLMASTSFDWAIEKLTFERWKNLHRFVYLAGILILFHSLILGTDLQNRLSPISLIMLVAVGFLLTLESIRIFKFLKKSFISQNNQPTQSQ